ncbi:MAG: hypothetical protein LBL83_12275 [Clostridiales bacterium]|jgi:lysophospholipase L1-like esterase|nr:hypothetical protein [Clostridiales bacterium]
MISRGLEFHNVAEIQDSSWGCRLYRFPRAVCDSMGEGERRSGRYVSQTTAGCEIRFVLEDGGRALLSLSSIDEDGYVQICCGDFRYCQGNVYSFPVRSGRATQIMLSKPPGLAQLDPRYLRGAFSPGVWRVMSDINFTMTFGGIETYGYAVRPPRPDEVPPRTLLCYGTSLTYGACASAHGVSYAQLLGRRLGCNILNKAMGGSCMNEKAVADYFAGGAAGGVGDEAAGGATGGAAGGVADEAAGGAASGVAGGEPRFDAVLLENGLNMDGMSEAYEKNTAYLLDRLAAACPEKPVYCVTSYPNAAYPKGCRAKGGRPQSGGVSGGAMRSDAQKAGAGESADAGASAGAGAGTSAGAGAGAGTSASTSMNTPDCGNDAIMRKLAARHKNCALIEGAEILDNFADLACDLVHLSDYGHIAVAERLSERIGWLAPR